MFLERAVMSDIDRFGIVFTQLMDTFASSFRANFIAKTGILRVLMHWGIYRRL